MMGMNARTGAREGCAAVKLSVTLLALAASLDGFGTGLSYGLRRIRVPWAALVLIAVCSGAAVWASMTLGGFAARLIPPEAARRAGALVLVAIGGWALAQQIGRRCGGPASEASAEPADEEAGRLASGAGKAVGRASAADGSAGPACDAGRASAAGRLLRILQSPPLADFDGSGSISAGEAIWLGAALSLDAFGAGVGAAWLGLPVAPTALASAVAGAALLYAGLKTGGALSGVRAVRRLSVLPGCLLVLLGIWKWFAAG